MLTPTNNVEYLVGSYKKRSYHPLMEEEENLLEPAPYALSSHVLQCVPRGPPKFHPALLYGLLILHIKPKYVGEKHYFKDEYKQHKQTMYRLLYR